MTKHPSLDIVESYGTELSGKKIVLCIAGSVAAYKSIELARLLMRHGANVKHKADQTRLYEMGNRKSCHYKTNWKHGAHCSCRLQKI